MKHSIIDTIADLNRSLAHDFRVTPLYAPDAPIFMAVAWPTCDRVTGLKPRLPAGRGTTLAQAMRSAGAEAIELRASLAQNHLSVMGDLPQRQGRAMVPGQNLLTGETALVPAQQVFLDFARISGEPLDHDADSTGCATGPGLADASLSALLECLERDAVALWWHGGLQAGALSLDLIDAMQPRLFWWLQERPRQTLLLDLTTDTGVAVVAAVSAEPDGHWVATGTAARLNHADAALAAVTEMLQTEAAMTQAAAVRDPDYLLWLGHACTRTMPQFQTRHLMTPVIHPAVSRALATDLTGILHRLRDLGHPTLRVDLTLPGDPAPTVRVLVPGLCAMQGRIAMARFSRLTGHKVPPDSHAIEPF